MDINGDTGRCYFITHFVYPSVSESFTHDGQWRAGTLHYAVRGRVGFPRMEEAQFINQPH